MSIPRLLSRPVENLTPGEIQLLLRQPEGWHLERKQKIDDKTGKVARAAASLSNCEGGFIILGVDQNGTILGTAEQVDAVYGHIATLTSPTPFAEIREHLDGGQRIILVRVLRSRTPVLYLHEMNYPIRYGSVTRHLDPRTIAPKARRKSPQINDVAFQAIRSEAEGLVATTKTALTLSLESATPPVAFVDDDLEPIRDLYSRWFKCGDAVAEGRVVYGVPAIALHDRATLGKGGMVLCGVSKLGCSFVAGGYDDLVASNVAGLIARSFGFYAAILRSYEILDATFGAEWILTPHTHHHPKSLTFIDPMGLTVPISKALAIHGRVDSLFGGPDACASLIYACIGAIFVEWSQKLPIKQAVEGVVSAALGDIASLW